jgi:predicted RNA-binding Zn ribbon-like protein
MSRVAHVLPPWLEPVLAFVNTVDVETGVDELDAGPAALYGWLVTHGLLASGAGNVAAPTVQADYRLALELRHGLRSLALHNNGEPADEPATMRMRVTLDRFPLVANVPPGGTGLTALRPHRLSPVRAALGVIVAGYAWSVATADWARIRRCPAGDCAWVFWDSSAKGSRRWCTMRVCGNRAKARTFAERRSAGQESLGLVGGQVDVEAIEHPLRGQLAGRAAVTAARPVTDQMRRAQRRETTSRSVLREPEREDPRAARRDH